MWLYVHSEFTISSMLCTLQFHHLTQVHIHNIHLHLLQWLICALGSLVSRPRPQREVWLRDYTLGGLLQ